MAFDIGATITVARLRLVCPKIRNDIVEAIVTDAPAAFPKAGLDSHIKAAHFISQIAAETLGLQRLDENLNYTTAKRLIDVFGKKLFPTLAAASGYLGQPEALANHVYASKNGNKNAGDGWAYRGSGLIQLTGRGNFHSAGARLGMPLEDNPDLARVSDSALAIALAYWTLNKISDVAGEASDAAVEKVTKRINAKMLGLDDRKAFFRKALKAFAPATPVSEAALRFAAPATLEAAAGSQAGGSLSGAQWAALFPTSRSIDDLATAFAGAVRKFTVALRDAGATVNISATYRPKERAYLMHWAWKIGKDGADPANVTPMAGVPIIWQHPTLAQSRAAARAMVSAYGMVQVAALNSRHTERLAIDMTISWAGDLSIKKADGAAKVISSSPRNGGNAALVAVGAGYGVIKLVSDPPHWSDDGR